MWWLCECSSSPIPLAASFVTSSKMPLSATLPSFLPNLLHSLSSSLHFFIRPSNLSLFLHLMTQFHLALSPCSFSASGSISLASSNESLYLPIPPLLYPFPLASRNIRQPFISFNSKGSCAHELLRNFAQQTKPMESNYRIENESGCRKGRGRRGTKFQLKCTPKNGRRIMRKRVRG